MRLFSLFFVLFYSTISLSQNNLSISNPLKLLAKEKTGLFINAGDTLMLTQVQVNTSSTTSGYVVQFMMLNTKNQKFRIDANEIKKLEFLEINDIKRFWLRASILKGTFEKTLSKGVQYDLRNSLYEDNLTYISSLEKNDRFFIDPYLEDYLYTLVSKIYNGVIIGHRTDNIVIKIIKDTDPNAFILSNGTIFITTGLLSTIRSEEELMGILAHEIAHFVLDHQIVNINEETERRKRAEFWAGLAIVASTGADIYLSTRYENHIPGLLTYSTAAISSIISSEVLERLGLKYSREQELEADEIAVGILKFLGIDSLGLSVVFERLNKHSILTGKYLALSEKGTHPSFDSRINIIGKVKDLSTYSNPDFLKKMSRINAYNAWIELWYLARYKNAIELAELNILNEVATESDYVVKAVALRRLYNNKTSNEEALLLIQTAKSLNVLPLVILNREEALTYLRLENKVEAKKSFALYLSDLIELQSSNTSKSFINNIDDEIRWTKTMNHNINKI
mgnify:CR=1 FL=1|jgi:Zn-dependent protease with chaperone function